MQNTSPNPENWVYFYTTSATLSSYRFISNSSWLIFQAFLPFTVFRFILLYVHDWLACTIRMCTTHAWYPRKSKERAGSPDTGVTWGCELAATLVPGTESGSPARSVSALNCWGQAFPPGLPFWPSAISLTVACKAETQFLLLLLFRGFAVRARHVNKSHILFWESVTVLTLFCRNVQSDHNMGTLQSRSAKLLLGQQQQRKTMWPCLVVRPVTLQGDSNGWRKSDGKETNTALVHFIQNCFWAYDLLAFSYVLGSYWLKYLL